MTTAEHYITQYRIMSKGIISTESTLAEDSLIGLDQLKNILADHDKEIISKIKEMIRKANPLSEDYRVDIDYDEYYGFK